MAKTAQPLAWHRKCLENQMEHLKDMETNLKRVQAEVERARADAKFYLDQLNEAVGAGKEEFDSNTYLKKRAPR